MNIERGTPPRKQAEGEGCSLLWPGVFLINNFHFMSTLLQWLKWRENQKASSPFGLFSHWSISMNTSDKMEISPKNAYSSGFPLVWSGVLSAMGVKNPLIAKGPAPRFPAADGPSIGV